MNAEDISSSDETDEIIRKVSTPAKRLKKRNRKYDVSVTEEEETGDSFTVIINLINFA